MNIATPKLICLCGLHSDDNRLLKVIFSSKEDAQNFFEIFTEARLSIITLQNYFQIVRDKINNIYHPSLSSTKAINWGKRSINKIRRWIFESCALSVKKMEVSPMAIG